MDFSFINWQGVYPGTNGIAMAQFVWRNQTVVLCEVLGAGTTVSTSGNTLTLSLQMQFSQGMTGANVVSEAVYGWDGGAGLSQIGSFTVVSQPIITTDSFLPPGILSTPGYSTAIAVQGGNVPYTWTAQGLPPGLNINSTGTIGGTPAVAGNFTPVITVTDALQHSATLNASLTIAAGNQTPTPPLTGDPNLPATDVGVFRGNASFLEDSNRNGIYDAGPDRFIPIFTGPGGFVTGDVPVAGDWTGDGTAKIGIYRSSTGTWYLDANNNGVSDAGDYTYSFGGLAGDMPVVGDWNGVAGVKGHKDCIGIYRSNGSVWLLDLNCNGLFDNTPLDAFFPFGGIPGDVPVAGKWAGGLSRAGVVRKYSPGGIPQGNPFFWVTDAGTANAGNLPANHPPSATPFAFGGLTGDVYVSGDWYGTGVSMAGVYRNGFWVMDADLPSLPLTNHAPGLTLSYGGVTGDIPLTGNWSSPVTSAVPTSLAFEQPLASSGSSATFSASWSDPSGDADALRPVQIAFAIPDGNGDYTQTAGSCAIQYYPPIGDVNGTTAGLGTLLLGDGAASPNQTFPYQSPIGAAGQTLSTGACLVDAANTTYTVTGAVATLTIPVMFLNQSAAPINYSVFTSASNTHGYDNWVKLSTWTAPPTQLISNSLTVNGGGMPGGSLNTGTFAAVFTDSQGLSDVTGVDIAFSTLSYGVSNVNGCHLQYIAPNLLLYSSVNGDSSYTSSPLGLLGHALNNGVCDVDASQSSVATGGNSLTLTAKVAFMSGNSPMFWAYTSVSNARGGSWVRFGFFQASQLPGPPSCSQISPASVINQAPVTLTLGGVQYANDVQFLVQYDNSGQSVVSAPVPGTRSADTPTCSFPACSTWQITFGGSGAPALGAYKVTPRLVGNSVVLACPAFLSYQAAIPPTQPAVPCGSAAGTWTDSVDNGTWTITQNLLTNLLSGAFSAQFHSIEGTLSCQGTWTIGADGASTISPAAGTFSIVAYPTSTSDPVNCPQSTSITETGTLTGMGCVGAGGKVTVTGTWPSGLTVMGDFAWTRPATIPDGETSTFESWSDGLGEPTVAQFTAALSSNVGLGFGGRNVIETQVGAVSDTCSFTGSAFTGYTGISGGAWNVQDNNYYSFDYVGLFPAVVGYLQHYGPLSWGGGRTSCSVGASQQMLISTSSLPPPPRPPLNYQNYGMPNSLVITVDQNGVSCSRASATGVRPFNFQ